MDYKITLQTSDGDETITCQDDQYILDAAEEAGAARHLQLHHLVHLLAARGSAQGA